MSSSRNDCACRHGMPDAALGCPCRILQLVEALAHDSVSALEIADRRRLGGHRMISQRRVALAHAFCVAKARLLWPQRGVTLFEIGGEARIRAKG